MQHITMIYKKHLTFIKYLCIINIGNDKSTNVVLPNRYKNSHLNRQIDRCEFFIYVVALSTQFL